MEKLKKYLSVKNDQFYHQGAVELLVFNFLLILTILTIWLFKKHRFSFLHETGGAMLYGLMMGLIVRYTTKVLDVESGTLYECEKLKSGASTLLINITNQVYEYQYKREISHHNVNGHQGNAMLQKCYFQPAEFHMLALFMCVFSLVGNSHELGKNYLSPGSMFVVYTLFECLSILFSVRLIMYGFVKAMVHAGQLKGLEFHLIDCLFFRSLMSATDPVTVLAIFHELHVDTELYTFLFGESVLNDAVAIVLTHSICVYSPKENPNAFDAAAFFQSVGSFLGIFAGSFAMGSSFAVVTALISFTHLTKFTKLCEFPVLETGLVFLLSWSAFLSAEATGLTGIVAILFCGVTQAHYTYNNLSPDSKMRTKQHWKFYIDNFIAYCTTQFNKKSNYPIFIKNSLIGKILARISVQLLDSQILNHRKQNSVSPSHEVHHFFCLGLRGAIAFALAIQDTESQPKQMMFTTAPLIVFFTVWIFGGGTTPMLTWLQIRLV
ncbi:SL9A9 protein, partial [Trogon melanurus]|nr:SL9A9 protein [Trogon melanurus]